MASFLIFKSKNKVHAKLSIYVNTLLYVSFMCAII